MKTTCPILLVEDDPDLRQDLAYLIEYEGYAVETASNGREALERLASMTRPCVIILDLMMPVMDGWELRAELLKLPELADVPVVLLSGVADVQSQAQSLKAVDYLTKPVDLKRLYAMVSAYC